MSYMYTCGAIGAETADEVLLRVPIRNRVVTDVSEVCCEYGREETRRAVCRVRFFACIPRRMDIDHVVYR